MMRRDTLGRALETFGVALLPACLGAALGYYLSDQGTPLLPDMAALLSLLALLGALLSLLGKQLRGRTQVETPEGTRLRRRVVAALLIGALALGGRLAVHLAEQESPLTALPRAELAQAFDQDLQRYRELEVSIEDQLRRLEAQPWLGAESSGALLDADQEALLLDSFEAIWEATVELDELRRFYEDWYRFDPSRLEREWHLRSFLLTFAAELSLHQSAARLSRLVLPHEGAKKLLDAPRPERGLPRTAFSLYRQELLGTRDQARVLAGERYLQLLALASSGREETAALGLSWLWKRCEAHLRTIEQVAPIERATLLARADAQVFKRALKRAWYPAQREVAAAMGDTRARRIGWYLIPDEQQAQAMELAEPGDVLLSRKNWYLSNAGLPGFWPHALLYLGTPEELKSWSDDPEIIAWIAEESGMALDLPGLLARRHPAAWARYASTEDGHPHVVIEAISEGVSFSTMPHAAGDYLAGLRPRLSKKARAQAIVAAFSHLDKPYDFDFDFATDAALVCTELVWRSYRPGPGKEGFELPLVRLAGRMTLPANEVALLYQRQAGQPDRLFDFVFFIDASERERRTWLSDEAGFRESPARSRLDVAVR